MKIFAVFAFLASLTISANALAISKCDTSIISNCREPVKEEPCSDTEKICKNQCVDVIDFVTEFKEEKQCKMECVQKTKEVTVTNQKEECKETCVTKLRPVTKYR